MNRAEWAEIGRAMQRLWPMADWDRLAERGTLEVWGTDMADFDGEQVKAAVTSLYRDGREWPPNSAHIRNRILELSHGSVTEGEAWELLQRAVRKFGHAADDKANEWLAEQDPIVAEAVQRLGYRDYCLSNLDDQTTWRAQFRRIFEQAGEQVAKGRRYEGIPGLPQREPRQLADALREQLPQIDGGT